MRNKGCAGMSYHLDYVIAPDKFDEVVEQDGVKVVVDSKALFSVIGSEMDWVEDNLGAKFVFKSEFALAGSTRLARGLTRVLPPRSKFGRYVRMWRVSFRPGQFPTFSAFPVADSRITAFPDLSPSRTSSAYPHLTRLSPRSAFRIFFLS